MGTACPIPLLAVDDDLDHARAAAEMLTELGWSVSIAGGVQAAREWLSDKPISVVLCDYNMPRETGMDLLREIDRQRCAFVMLTGLSRADVVAEALRLDCDDYAFKPVENWEELSEKLRRVGADLKARVDSRREAAKLAQMADWQAWKASFLKKGQEDDMQQLLRMLHVQFNQDSNFSQLLDLVENVAKGDRSKTMRVKVPIDVLELVVSALRPVARFSDGIGIAAKLLGDAPLLRSVNTGDFVEALGKEWASKWKQDATLRNHALTVYFAKELRLVSGTWMKMDPASMYRALNELMVNAFKHSDPGSEIHFNVSSDKQRLSIVVTNVPQATAAKIGNVEAFGLPREFEAQAFRLFYRLRDEAAITLYQEDWPMGLGLPLVRSVFLAAGGEVTVHNELWHLGGGSEPRTLVTARGTIPLFAEPPIALEEAPAEGAAAADVELF